MPNASGKAVPAARNRGSLLIRSTSEKRSTKYPPISCNTTAWSLRYWRKTPCGSASSCSKVSVVSATSSSFPGTFSAVISAVIAQSPLFDHKSGFGRSWRVETLAVLDFRSISWDRYFITLVTRDRSSRAAAEAQCPRASCREDMSNGFAHPLYHRPSPHLRRPGRGRANRAAGSAAARLCGIDALLARAGERACRYGLLRDRTEPTWLFEGRAAGRARCLALSYRAADG